MKYQLLLLLAFSMEHSALSQNASVTWSAFDMGFERSSTTNVVVKSVVGQSFVERMSSGNTFISSGFLGDTLILGPVTSVGVSEVLPTEFSIGQNYPNPFNPVTTIRFTVPIQSHVTIVVYNILGQVVRTLVDDDMAPGNHIVRFDAYDVSSGVYFYVMRSGAFSQTRKLIILR